MNRLAWMVAALLTCSGAAQTVTLTLDSPQHGSEVVPGAVLDWEIRFDVSSGDNAGLALISIDLVQEPNNAALFDLDPASGVPGAMDNFSRPNGISNPGETDPVTGYIGVQRGTPGALNLRQIGGAQNTFGAAQAPGTGVAESATVVGGIGQSGSVVLASGTLTMPMTEGIYGFALVDPVANTLVTIGTAPDVSTVTPATLGFAQERIWVTVSASAACGSNCDVPGGDADVNNDCVVDLSDVAVLLANFGKAQANIPGDTDGDDEVTLTDLANVLAKFGKNCPLP